MPTQSACSQLSQDSLHSLVLSYIKYVTIHTKESSSHRYQDYHRCTGPCHFSNSMESRGLGRLRYSERSLRDRSWSIAGCLEEWHRGNGGAVENFAWFLALACGVALPYEVPVLHPPSHRLRPRMRPKRHCRHYHGVKIAGLRTRTDCTHWSCVFGDRGSEKARNWTCVRVSAVVEWKMKCFGWARVSAHRPKWIRRIETIPNHHCAKKARPDWSSCPL